MLLEFLAIHVVVESPKGMCGGFGCLLLKSQQTSQVGGKFALFQMLATGGGRMADVSPEANSFPTDRQGVRAFIEELGRGEVTCRNSTSHLQIGHQWSD